MEETITLKKEKTGRLKIVDNYPKSVSTHTFSTPDSNGKEFARILGVKK